MCVTKWCMRFEIPRIGNTNKVRTITGISLISPDEKNIDFGSYKLHGHQYQTPLKMCTDVVNVVVQLGVDLLHQPLVSAVITVHPQLLWLTCKINYFKT